jgi:hypothetical protein
MKMSVMIASKPRALNSNIKSIINYLDKQYPCTWDDLEQDLTTGLTNIERELTNMYLALVSLKNHHKNDQKQITTINQYLKMLMKENIRFY